MVRHVHDGRDYWTLPGGGIEAGESPAQAAQREVHEETGLQVEAVRFLFWHPNSGPGRTLCFLMSSPPPGQEIRRGVDPG